MPGYGDNRVSLGEVKGRTFVKLLEALQAARRH